MFRNDANSASPNSASAPAMNPSTKIQNRCGGAASQIRTGCRRRHQRMLALDHAARDIVGDGVDDRRDLMGLGDDDAAEPGILHEAVDALVASHQHMGDHVDPQPRRIALADAAIEQIDLIRNLREQRVERIVQNFQPRHFGVAQVDDDPGAISGLDPRLPQRIAQPEPDAIRRRHGFRYLTRLTSAWSPLSCMVPNGR